MSTTANGPTTVGLPGRNIRPTGKGTYSSPKPTHKSHRPSPPGLSVDTNVQPVLPGAGPKQIYPEYRSNGARAMRKQKPTLNLRRNPSPFDRAVAICSSPQTMGGKQEVFKSRQLSPETARTPRIVVTPVEEHFGQTSPLPHRSELYSNHVGFASNKQHPPRIASSIYSPIRGTHHTRTPSQSTRPRSSSIGTIFEDDDGSSRGRADIVNRSTSLDSILSTPRRSVGWWNLITSPVPGRSETGLSKRPANIEGDEEEHTPLLEKDAAVTDLRDPSRLDDAETRRLIKESPFHSYTIPTSGEAVKYYDTAFKLSTPVMVSNDHLLPDPVRPISTRSMEELSPVMSDDNDRSPSIQERRPPATRNNSHRVPSPTLPAQTPPRSAVAAFVDQPKSPPMNQTTAAPPPPTTSSRSVRPTLSTFSSSPVLGTAQIQHIHTVKTLDPVPSSPMSEPPRTRSQSRTPNTAGLGLAPKNTSRSSSPASKASKAARQTASQDSPRAQTPANNSSRSYQIRAGGPTPTVGAAPQSQRRLASPFATPMQGSGRSQRKPQPERKPTITLGPPLEKEMERAPDPNPSKHSSCCQRHWLSIAVCLALFAVVITSIVLAMTLTNSPASMPVEVAWLNLTGFPPMPTGISTVARPSISHVNSGCVSIPNMWQCALPKEEQSVAPNTGPTPNFRFEIMSNKHAFSNASLVQRQNQSVKRDLFADTPFTPNPSPPNLKDITFLGNTTDKITAPFIGEHTPFYISILETTEPANSSDSSNHSITRRAALSNSTLNMESIPSPSLLSNGTISPAQLYPYPTAQPLRLFSRGLQDEHYGFYTYFPRTIYLSLANTTTSSASTSDPNSNTNGGTPLADANTMCTFTQTRFHVQIWTRMGSITQTSTASTIGNANNTSAFDFTPPGSFPYPVTISLDRHGGSAKEKGVVCYALDSQKRIVGGEMGRAVQVEDRAFGGTLVNPASGPFEKMGDVSDGSAGGVDGGTGGCGCVWQNFGG